MLETKEENTWKKKSSIVLEDKTYLFFPLLPLSLSISFFLIAKLKNF